MKKIAVIGAGASGLACAVEAARNSTDTEITLYEAADRVGRKILATGNGRCNLTNINMDSRYYHGCAGFAADVMREYTPLSNIAFFNSIGLYTKTEQGGRVYPMSAQAASVLDALRYAVGIYGVKTVCGYRIDRIERYKKGFLLNGSEYADAVVVAAGGMVPAGKGDVCNSYSLLSCFGHSITPVYPALVQLTCRDKALKSLKGIRVDAVLTLCGEDGVIRRQEGELLFTDYGLSGIVSMQLSSDAARYVGEKGKEPTVLVDLVPLLSFEELKSAVSLICSQMPSLPSIDLLNGFMSKRVGQTVIGSCINGAQTVKCAQLSSRDITRICSKAKKYGFVISGTRGFSSAQVTAGGADTASFNPGTLESKLVRGLFCCGEALDVDGDCGGYNLQWAWSSGRLAGKSAADYVKKH